MLISDIARDRARHRPVPTKPASRSSQVTPHPVKASRVQHSITNTVHVPAHDLLNLIVSCLIVCREWPGRVEVAPPVEDLTGEVAIVSDQVAVLVARFEYLRLWVNPIRSRNRVVLTRFTDSTRIVVINIDNKVADRVVRPFTVHQNLTHKAE